MEEVGGVGGEVVTGSVSFILVTMEQCSKLHGQMSNRVAYVPMCR